MTSKARDPKDNTPAVVDKPESTWPASSHPLPDTKPPEPVPPVAHPEYEVERVAMFTTGGVTHKLAQGMRVSEMTHDIPEMKKQGVPLKQLNPEVK